MYTDRTARMSVCPYDLTHFLYCRDNKYQFIAHFDQSVQHNKKGSDSLVASRMGLRWGGTQPKLRDTKVCPVRMIIRLPCIKKMVNGSKLQSAVLYLFH